MTTHDRTERHVMEPEGEHGTTLANISRRIVQLHKEHYGEVMDSSFRG